MESAINQMMEAFKVDIITGNTIKMSSFGHSSTLMVGMYYQCRSHCPTSIRCVDEMCTHQPRHIRD